jgi:hypothetical protein
MRGSPVGRCDVDRLIAWMRKAISPRDPAPQVPPSRLGLVSRNLRGSAAARAGKHPLTSVTGLRPVAVQNSRRVTLVEGGGWFTTALTLVRVAG